MYPKVEIYLKNILENIQKIKEVCEKQQISFSPVVKVLAGHKEIIQSFFEIGMKNICDSRIENLKIYQDIPLQKWLIRSPMLSEVSDVITYTDVSFNSEMEVIKALNIAAKKQGTIHKIILMYELGDLREGCLKEELDNILKQTLSFSNIQVYGIGANLSCYGEIIPTNENMQELVDIVEELEAKYQFQFPIVSGGNSSSYKMLEEGKIPKKINHLRLGESIFLGNVPCFEEKIPTLHQNNFLLKAEIIELKTKPSIPRGVKGRSNSFGEDITFIDRGDRLRAIVALGKQDVHFDSLQPIDKEIIILGGSSDHLILDVEESKKHYQVGDIITFTLNYAGVLDVMTSKYIKKEIVGD